MADWPYARLEKPQRLRERSTGPNGTQSERILVYRVPSDDLDTAMAYAPSLRYTPNGVEYLVDRDVEVIADGYCKLKLTYRRFGLLNDWREDFSLHTKTENLKQAIQQHHWTGAQENVTGLDFGRRIGITEDGIQGTDVYAPRFSISRTEWFTTAQVTHAYIDTLYELTGTVNDSEWNGFDTADLLFLGTRGSMREDGFWELRFEFAASPTTTYNVTVDGTVYSITKPGWDHLWYRYKMQVDTVDGQNVKIPHIKSAHLAQIYPRKDFTRLGIGT